jgi:hypothetical protein
VGDLILNSENIVKFAIVPIGPDVVTALGTDELYSNAQAITHLANTTLEYVTHIKFTPYLPYVNCLPLVKKDELRDMTTRLGIFERAVIISSDIPSAK